jgi:hypothetical protein
MDLVVKKLDEVWTEDDKKLGLAQELLHRLEAVNPDLLYYASYLEVESYEYGMTYFVPTDFIAVREPESGRVTLTATLKDVMDNTWFVIPDFIVRSEARKETLAEE